MPGQKISTLSAVSSLQENDQFPIARNGTTYKITGSKITSPELLYTAISGISSLNLTTYADNDAAIAGNLPVNSLYKTSSGEIRIVV